MTDQGKKLAITAESLYVANLLILPLLGFALLLILYLRHRHSAAPLARSHLQQTMAASVWLAILLLLLGGGVLLLHYAGMADVTGWILVVILFTVLHATMVLLGVVGLARAMAGKCWRYPLIGPRLPDACPE